MINFNHKLVRLTTVLSICTLIVSCDTDNNAPIIEHTKATTLNSQNCDQLKVNFSDGKSLAHIKYYNRNKNITSPNWVLLIDLEGGNTSGKVIDELPKEYAQISAKQFSESISLVLRSDKCRPAAKINAIIFDLGLVSDYWEATVRELRENTKSISTIAWPYEQTKVDVIKATLLSENIGDDICGILSDLEYKCRQEGRFMGITPYFIKSAHGKPWSEVSNFTNAGLAVNTKVFIKLKYE